MTIVVDANIWLAAFRRDEPSHEDATRFFQTTIEQGWSFAEPVLVLPEVASAAARVTRHEAEGQEATERLRSTPGLKWFDITPERAELAASLASRLFLKGADAIYAALASELDLELVTLDRELQARAAPEVKAISPAAWMALHPTTAL